MREKIHKCIVIVMIYFLDVETRKYSPYIFKNSKNYTSLQGFLQEHLNIVSMVILNAGHEFAIKKFRQVFEKSGVEISQKCVFFTIFLNL